MHNRVQSAAELSDLVVADVEGECDWSGGREDVECEGECYKSCHTITYSNMI